MCALSALLISSACTKDTCTQTVTHKKWVPVYKTVDEMREPATVGPPRNLKNPGRIFVSGNYLLINERHEGVHIVDNTNPADPTPVAFVDVPGNTDMAVKDHLLFLDSYFDIISVDITNPTAPIIAGRSKDAFPSNKYPYNSEKNAFVVDYEEKIVTETFDCTTDGRGIPIFADYHHDVVFTPRHTNSGSGSSAPSINIAGSMASMLVVGDYLYCIHNKDIWIFSAETTPTKQRELTVGWGIETLFPYGDKLFIGSRTGMYIYDNADPLNPVKLSQFMHYRACDPVFVKDDIAYITLRDGTMCQNADNQLHVVDVRDLTNPKLIKRYPMFHPHGLAVDDQYLYLCDGAAGLKVFGIKDLYAITNHLKKHFPQIDAYDVIRLPHRALLILIGKDGLYQFDLNDDIDLISKIPISD